MKNGSFLILFRKHKSEVFLVLRSDFPVWVPTGGGIDEGESPKKAAIREAKEETDFKIKLIRKLGVYHITAHGKKRKTHVFEGKYISGKFKPEFPGCKGKWFNIDNLPKNTTKQTREKIQRAANHRGKPFSIEIEYSLYRDNFKLFLKHPIKSIQFINSRR